MVFVTPIRTAPSVCADQKSATSWSTRSATCAAVVPSDVEPAGMTVATVTWLVNRRAGTTAGGGGDFTIVESSTGRAGAAAALSPVAVPVICSAVPPTVTDTVASRGTPATLPVTTGTDVPSEVTTKLCGPAASAAAAVPECSSSAHVCVNRPTTVVVAPVSAEATVDGSRTAAAVAATTPASARPRGRARRTAGAG